MQLEQGVETLLLFGFSIILVIVAIFIFFLFFKYKNKGLLWFIPQLLLLCLCCYLFLLLTKNKSFVSHAMLSEENSLIIGYLGISWALSMFFMILGISSILKHN
mgnify:CR=1 FL=1